MTDTDIIKAARLALECLRAGCKAAGLNVSAIDIALRDPRLALPQQAACGQWVCATCGEGPTPCHAKGMPGAPCRECRMPLNIHDEPPAQPEPAAQREPDARWTVAQSPNGEDVVFTTGRNACQVFCQSGLGEALDALLAGRDRVTLRVYVEDE